MPIRRYDFTQLIPGATVYSRATLSLQERALTPLCERGDLVLCDIRDFVYHGLNNSKVRANCWKVLLKAYPPNPLRWVEKRRQNVQAYREFINEFIISQNSSCGKENCNLVPSPIDTSWKRDVDYCSDNESLISNESLWSREFGDSEIREIIWKDVERTYSDIDFFHCKNRNILARILFIFGKLNNSLQYVQGMNELLAPLLYVFADAEGQLDQEVSEDVEADTFFAFNVLMSEMRDLFLRQMDNTSMGL